MTDRRTVLVRSMRQEKFEDIKLHKSANKNCNFHKIEKCQQEVAEVEVKELSFIGGDAVIGKCCKEMSYLHQLFRVFFVPPDI